MPTPQALTGAPAPNNEAELSTLVANVLIRAGIMVTRYNSGAARNGKDYVAFYRVLGIRDSRTGKERRIESGKADLNGTRNGFCVEIECKMPGESQRATQRTYEAVCRHYNNPYEIVQTVDDAFALLDKYAVQWGIQRGKTYEAYPRIATKDVELPPITVR